jgi:hypothetical protein
MKLLSAFLLLAALTVTVDASTYRRSLQRYSTLQSYPEEERTGGGDDDDDDDDDDSGDVSEILSFLSDAPTTTSPITSHLTSLFLVLIPISSDPNSPTNAS